jgi:hypothetical protein
MYSSFAKGQQAQLMVELWALEKGIIVSKPTVEARYDLVLDDHGVFSRAQVKYAGIEHGGAVQVDLRKETRGNGKKKVYTANEVDCIIVYVPKIKDVFYLSASLFDGRKSLSLRIEPCKNHQTKGVVLAKDLRW